MSDIDVKKLTIADLKKELTARGVAFQSSALKAALQTLLADAIAKEKEAKANPVTETPSAPVSDAVKPTPAPAAVEPKPAAVVAPVAAPAVAAPVAAVPEPAAASESTETGHADTTHEDKQLSDAEKKLLRAQKFGIPVKPNDPARVKQRKERFGTFSEEEKKSKRAERFAGGKKVEMTVEDKNAVLSDDKKQSRAARFGIPVKEVKQSVVSTSKEEQQAFNDKKRKRAERFGIPEPEESKRQKRAERFAGNGNGNAAEGN
eukprot:TRINITY_DN2947_c0_g1_i1.p1 TRINITY_DN2947_c0_g1~~TRINITY_DN2947_c0_g1_i1.p1  ORF type:complete len:277 (-),score=106.10 TRINITY_DN2947_c0_g1_i1:85-867(-)